ncbi:pilus assembly protein PilP [Halomonas sp. BC04]|uniref:pilus assembly protein PilP n=1 Tax=Halomonas sp. BC04 TaxID=1403540 RepID=UPI003FA5D007
MSSRRHRWLGASAGLVLALAGCADPQLSSLDRELAEIRANPGMPEPLELPEVPRYAPTPYEEGDRRSPFRPQLPEPEARPAGDAGVAPDADRPREPLETYSLEELELVGVLTMGGQSNASSRRRMEKSIACRSGATWEATTAGSSVSQGLRCSWWSWCQRAVAAGLSATRASHWTTTSQDGCIAAPKQGCGLRRGEGER